MFERTRIKLTAWYLLIIMTISLLFSIIIYSMINVEFVRFEKVQQRIQYDMRNGFIPVSPRIGNIVFEDVREARIRLISRLGMINFGILIFAGGAGYFLAGRTLRPIKKSMDEQNRFISDSSHELRTPLTSLRSEIEVNLMNKKLSKDKARKVLESNLDEVIHLQILSDRLLELAQSGELTNKDSFVQVSLAEVIDNAIKKNKNKSEKKRIKITKNTKNMSISGDLDGLTEVFVILIDNAIKYSKSNSKIEIYTKNKKREAIIYVKDSGSGISKKDIPYIFDRFYREEKSRSLEGYGLGLSIARKILLSHGGSIKVESELNKGTTFIVSLPANL